GRDQGIADLLYRQLRRDELAAHRPVVARDSQRFLLDWHAIHVARADRTAERRRGDYRGAGWAGRERRRTHQGTRVLRAFRYDLPLRAREQLARATARLHERNHLRSDGRRQGTTIPLAERGPQFHACPRAERDLHGPVLGRPPHWLGRLVEQVH